MTTPCPPDDVLGALVQRMLGDDESEHVRSHIDECDLCAQTVLAAVRGGVMDTQIAPTLARGTPNVAEATVREPAAIGARIGRYEVRALLGAGGMGHVYEAYDRELDRSIALKVLRPELAVAQVLTDRLMRESRLMAKVTHPAVITVYDVGREVDTVFIAMELIRGETLGVHLSRDKRDWRTIIELFERAGEGLAAAHRAGIVHRDFKPDNVLVELVRGEPARVVVTDFGIARATAIADEIERVSIARPPTDPRMTATGSAIGTPAYMAPEQLGGHPVDLRADVFAFAGSLWEALFGARPFPGETIDEIRVAMMKAPRAPFGVVPRGVVRALERGLAIDPRDRWQDMMALVRELAKLRSRRRRTGLALGITALAAAGIAGAFMIGRPGQDDPCTRATLAYDAPGLAAAISDQRVRDIVVAKVTTTANAWKQTHRATCKADRHPVQAPTTSACLESRKIELVGYVADVIADRGTFALDYGGVIGDPTLCVEPPPGLLAARTPADPVLRRKVTALRYRGFAAQAARDHADFKTALAQSEQLVKDTKDAWPLVHAEALYLLGSTRAMGGDTKTAIPTLREAAAIAETAHHDYIAANSWIQLVISSTFDEGAPERGLEYATYAAAALDRLGRPPSVMALFEYAKGTTLVEADRLAEAEVSLRRAVELSEKHAPDYLPLSIQGLGYLYEQQGHYAKAVEAYRHALAKLPATGPGVTSGAIVFRQRLAINLSLLGKQAEAEIEARRGLEVAEKVLGPENLDRAIARTNLAQVLQTAGKLDEALAEVRTSLGAIAKIDGVRGERYGEVLQLEAGILSDLGRYAEATKQFTRACDIIAFQTGEGSTAQAECWLSETIALSGVGKHAAALVLIEKALPVLVAAYGDVHPQVANALVTRGALHAELGHHAEAIRDLERAVANFEKVTLEPGHLGAARWALAKELWTRDPLRARALLEQALRTFDKAGASWAQTRAEAAEWLATNGKPKRR